MKQLPIVRDNTAVIGPFRLSYAYLTKPYSHDGDPGKGKYMTNVLIPKSDKATIKAIEKAIESAKKSAIASKWGGKEPKKLDIPLRDGDEKDDELYADHFYINAKTSNRPGVCDKNRAPIFDEDEIYSGMWAVVSIDFYGYDISGNRGIAVGLRNVMKVKDGERLGGTSSAENDFDGIEFEDDDDDL